MWVRFFVITGLCSHATNHHQTPNSRFEYSNHEIVDHVAIGVAAVVLRGIRHRYPRFPTLGMQLWAFQGYFVNDDVSFHYCLKISARTAKRADKSRSCVGVGACVD